MQHNLTIIESMANQIESDLRQLGWWSETPIDPALFEQSNAAFFADVMSFGQWLQFVFLPRVREELKAGANASWPGSSHVGAYAVRELDGQHEAGELIDHL
ncbi:MAG TPA: YqcC family protein, partial [Tepidisphaeraceae bacterium]|nr:YqcC family protein [Tepidisphaeraceae bacterium]